MSYVTLEQAKAHLLVIHDADDALIQQNIDAAEAYAANYMNRQAIADKPVYPWRKLWTVGQVLSETPDPVPKSVVQAVSLLTSDFYENRTVGIVGTIFTTNPSAENLLWQYRVGMGI